MTEIEYGRKLSFSSKCIIIALVALAFIAAFIPLWQIGVNNSIKHEIMYSQHNLDRLDQEERALRAAIAIDTEVSTGKSNLKASN